MQENNQNFNHLKIHTQYSICEGAIKIDDLKNFCKTNKIKSIGLSDTTNLCGALEFSEEISKAGTQPIIGTQINFKFKNEIGMIPLIAKNQKGYETILKLSSNSYLLNQNSSTPYCEIKELDIDNNGLIVLSGSLNSLSGKLFLKNRLKELHDLYAFLNKKFDAFDNLTQRLLKKLRQIMSLNMEYLFQSSCETELFNDDCISLMEKIPENSVDLIFADPPSLLIELIIITESSHRIISSPLL